MKLKVGQEGKYCGYKVVIRIIENGRVCYWHTVNKWFNDTPVENFLKRWEPEGE